MSSYLSSLVDYFSPSFYGTPATVATKTSTMVVHRGEHLFKVSRHSRIKGIMAKLLSKTFRVGDYDWAIRYYPNGDGSITDGQFTSLFLQLESACESEVTASFTLSLQDPATPATGEKNKFGFTKKFLSKGQSWGIAKFVSKANLAASGCLKDDCLLIKCTVEVIGVDDEDTGIVVPPSDISKDLRYLLDTSFKADLTIMIGSFKSFDVHGCILAARSPVFRALLCGSMMESKQSSISIEDMDADVFEVLLYYMYNDCLPEFMDDATEEAANMAQHLLVVADRYAVERLKLLCETKLSKALDVNTVGFILDLAEQYYCPQLKAHGLVYIEKCECLEAVVNTEGFIQLKHNYPFLADDVLTELRCKKNRRKKKQKRQVAEQ